MALAAAATARKRVRKMDDMLKTMLLSLKAQQLLAQYQQFWSADLDRMFLGVSNVCLRCRLQKMLAQFGLDIDDVPLNWPKELQW